MQLSSERRALDWVCEYIANLGHEPEPAVNMQSYMSNGCFRALDVNQFDESALLRPKAHGENITNQLPTKEIQPWSKELSVAIVSWRWDGDMANKDPAYGSRNLCAVITYAKTVGIQYLLIDVISIDQKASSTMLMDTLQDFNTYYETLPVLCAYQMASQSIRHNVRRPWIFSELQHMQLNPKRLTHIRHTMGQDPPSGPIFQAIWHTKVRSIVLGLLYGTVQMHTPTDLQYIVPTELADLIFRASYRFKGSDFYLAAILLIKACEMPDRDWYDALRPGYAWAAKLEKFVLKPGTNGRYEIVLKLKSNTTTIGYWYPSANSPAGSKPYSIISTDPDALVIIIKYMDASEYPRRLRAAPHARLKPDMHEVDLDLSTGKVIDSRALQIQVTDHDEWNELAEAMHRFNEEMKPAVVSGPEEREMQKRLEELRIVRETYDALVQRRYGHNP